LPSPFPTILLQHSKQLVQFFKYGILEHDLKDCVASIGVVDGMNPFMSGFRTLYVYVESNVCAFEVADPMAALVFLMAGGEYP